LHRVSQALLEYETLSGNDVQQIMRGEPIERGDNRDSSEPTDSKRPPMPADGPSVRPTRKSSGGSVPGLQPGN
jgi:cell division protease FtsH